MKGRWWLWAVLLLAVIGFTRLRFDVEVLNLLPDSETSVAGLKKYQAHFSNARELIVTLSSESSEVTESAARLLARELEATPAIGRVVWQPPWRQHPEASGEFIAYLWFNQPPETFSLLSQRLEPETARRQVLEVREQLSTSFSPEELARRGYDPLGLTELPQGEGAPAIDFAGADRLFVSDDGKFRVLFVEPGHPLKNYQETIRWFDQVKARVNKVTSTRSWPSQAKVGYTGGPAFMAEVSGGMEKDLSGSLGGTMVVIAILFWLVHRNLRALLWLLTLLLLVLTITLGFGGLIFGTLNVVSAGFVGILLGLVDYGYVIYQEARDEPSLSADEIRRLVGPGICWSALITSGAFLMLNLSGLPGLSQLGTLVGIGMIWAAVILLAFFLPPLRKREILPASTHHEPVPPKPESWMDRSIRVSSLLLLVGCAALLWFHPPQFEYSGDALRPRESPSFAALEELKKNLGRKSDPLWLIVSGKNEQEVADRLLLVRKSLGSTGNVQLTLPDQIWPNPAWQQANRPQLERVEQRRPQIRALLLENGFASNTIQFTDSILAGFAKPMPLPGVFWPEGPLSEWILNKSVARESGEFLAMGFLELPEANSPRKIFDKVRELEQQFAGQPIWFAGWEHLGVALQEMVKSEIWKVTLPMLVLLLICLSLAYRSWEEVLLSLLVLGFSLLVLSALMQLFGWSWNLLNIMSLPLLLGAGVDYSIHMQMALRRKGNIRAARRSIGRALLLCAATNVTGFGSLAWSGNAGLASLGQVCAVGILLIYLASVFVLPSWWMRLAGPRSAALA